PFELPFYSAETLASAIDLTHRVLVPRVAGRAFASPEVVDETLRAEIRGNAFARAGVETAAWDLAAHRAGVGMAQLVAGRLGVAPAAGGRWPPMGWWGTSGAAASCVRPSASTRRSRAPRSPGK